MRMEFWGGLAFTYLPLKRFYKYILKRLIGAFLRHDIDLEQLEVQLYMGIVQLRALELDVAQFNTALQSAGLLLQFVSGFVGCIKMDVPWRHLLRDNCKIYVSDLDLVLAKCVEANVGVADVVAAPEQSDTAGRGYAARTTALEESLGPEKSPSRYSYSEDGVETLSRLVKHVLSRVELCFQDVQASVVAAGAPSALQARVSSTVVFAEQPSGEAEERSLRLSGLSVSLVPVASVLADEHQHVADVKWARCTSKPLLGHSSAKPPSPGQFRRNAANGHPANVSADAEDRHVLLALMDAPEPGTNLDPAPSGVLSVRRRDIVPVESEFAGTGGYASSCGSHLDVDLFVHSLRLVLTLASSRCLMKYVAALQGRQVIDSAAEADGMSTEPDAAGTRFNDVPMVQSLVESTLVGKPSEGGFWYDMYNLFEADSQLEDAAAGARAGAADATEWADRDVDGAALADEARVLGPPAASHEGPVVSYAVRIHLVHTAALLVLTDDSYGAAPRPADVNLVPGPFVGASGDQAQLCITRWELVVTQQVPIRGVSETSSPNQSSMTLTGLTRAISVHLHRHIGKASVASADDDFFKCSCDDIPRSADGNMPRALARHGEVGSASSSPRMVATSSMRQSAHTPVFSESFVDSTMFLSVAGMVALPSQPSEPYIDPSLFCSARSAGLERSELDSPRALTRGISDDSCITVESIGGEDSEDEDSFLHSAASSLRSFDANSVQQSLANSRVASSVIHEAGIDLTAHVDVASYAEPGTASELEARFVHGAPTELEEETETQDEVEARSPQSVELEPTLEAMFFDRAAPIRDRLLGQRRVGVGMDVEGYEVGSNAITGNSAEEDIAGWSQVASNFRSKRLFYAVIIEGPEQEESFADQTVADEDGELRASNSCPKPAADTQPALTLPPPHHPLWQEFNLTGGECKDNQLRVEWTSSSSSTPRLKVESQPLVLSLCAESIELLGSGVALLTAATVVTSDTSQRAVTPLHVTRNPDVVGATTGIFDMVGVTPLLRLELLLNASEKSYCSLVGDVVAPRVLACPISRCTQDEAPLPRSIPESSCLYNEIFRADLADVSVYLLSENVPSDGAAMLDATPRHTRCKRVLSLDGSHSPTITADAKGAVSIFQRADCIVVDPPESHPAAGNVANLSEGLMGAVADSASGSCAPSSAVPGFSDWTKISLPQLPSEGGRDARSSQLLHDLRHASQRFLRANHKPASANASSSFGFALAGGDSKTRRDAKNNVERMVEECGSDCGVAVRAQSEVELRLPTTLRFRLDANSLLVLQDCVAAFGVHLSDLSSARQQGQRQSQPQQTHPEVTGRKELLRPPADAREDSSPAPFAFSMCVECLEFEVEEDAHAASHGGTPEQLCFQLARIECRSVQVSRTSWKSCALGQDFRLLGIRPSQAEPEQFIRPWFRPLLHVRRDASCAATDHAPACSAVDPSDLFANYPWEAQHAQVRGTLVAQAFSDMEGGCWTNANSILLQFDQCKVGAAEHTNVAVRLGKVWFSAHPHVQQVAARLATFFCPPGPLARSPLRTPVATGASAVYQLSIADALIDMPSGAYAQSWPITSPNGLDVPTPPPTTRGLDDDKWRAVFHVGGLQLSGETLQGSSQGVKVCCGQLNNFLVDHPGNLADLDILSTSKDPAAFLAGLGFARVLAVSDASAVWRFRSPSLAMAGADAVQFTSAGQAVEVVVGSIDGSVCPDSAKCLLCMGMDIVDLMPQPPEAGIGKQAGPVDGIVEDHRLRSTARASDELSLGRLNIIEHIDSATFEGTNLVSQAAVSSSLPRRTSSDECLGGCLIEDYIRDAEKMQNIRSPLQVKAMEESAKEGLDVDFSLPDAFETWDFDDEMATHYADNSSDTGTRAREQTPCPVAFCLLDPAAYPEDRLRELCLEDQAAREEAEQLYATSTTPKHGRDSSVSASSAPQLATRLRQAGSYCSSGAAPAEAQAHQRYALHEDCSAAAWLVDPDGVQVVEDHFVELTQPSDDQKLLPFADSPPVELAVTVRCGSVTLSLYGGADFKDDGHRVESSAAGGCHAGRRRHAAHLSLELMETAISLMHFDASVTAPEGGSSSSTTTVRPGQPAPLGSGILKRRLVVCMKDFGIADHVPGSVFSHVLSYFEDERRRPRPSGVDMLYTSLDEVVMDDSVDPEYCLELRLLPLRLTLDQDVVDFLVDFLQLCALPTYVEEEQDTVSFVPPATGSEPRATSTRFSATPEAMLGGRGDVEAPAMDRRRAATEATTAAAVNAAPHQAAIFQRVWVGPLLLSVDYRAKRLDVAALRRGELWELVNLLPLLEGLEIPFRHVTLTSVSGLSQVFAQVVAAWSADLNRTQILRSLTGVTPIRSFANIGGGFAELVLEPLKQYRAGSGKKQITRAVLRGLVSFMRHVTVESIDLTERIVVGTQSALEYATSCLSESQAHAPSASNAVASSRSLSSAAAAAARAAPNTPEDLFDSENASMSWTTVQRGASEFVQPSDAAEGLQQASTSLLRGVRHAGEAVIVRPMLEFQRGASKGKVLRSVAAGIPMCVLRPAIGATAAATTALRGMRNQVDPHHRREMERKYKAPE